MAFEHTDDVLFAKELGLAVDSCGGACLVFLAGGVVGLSSEDVVCGDVYKESIYLFHCFCKVLGGCGVEFFYEFVFLGVFCSIYVGPCCTVDDGFHVMFLDHLPDGFEICDVEEGGFHSLGLGYVGEDIVGIALTGKDAYFVAKLAVGTCYKYVHFEL